MDFSKIDKNFKQAEVSAAESNIYTFPNDNFTLLGGFYDEKLGFCRMDHDIASRVSNGVEWGSRCTTGIRLLFTTNSTFFRVKGEIYDKLLLGHMTFVGSASLTLCEVVDGKEIFVGNLTPPFGDSSELKDECSLGDGKTKNYILYFPLYSGVSKLTIELSEGSTVRPFNKYKKQKPILYYGSSITQGGCASRPDNCYQALVSEWTNIDYWILGFSGNAKGEPLMCDYLRDFDCSIFVCDYDHNAPNAEFLAKTHLNLYLKFREGKNKDVPIIFLSKPDGTRDSEGKERYNIIKKTVDYARAHGDKNVYLINGMKIYPSYVSEHCSVDGCHPEDLGFYFFAKKIYAVIKRIESKA